MLRSLIFPKQIEAAVITVPAKFVAGVVEECGKKGIKGLIIITSGFGESGRHDLEDEIVEIAQQYDTRILGPNIVGVLSNSYKMNASFAPFLPLNGKATLISQSGALLIAIDAATYVRKVGFNKLISIGNMSDVDFADLIDWLNEDEDTTCITLYIEGLKDGRSFMDVSRKATQTDHRHQIGCFRARRGSGGFAHRLAGRRGQGLQRRLPAGRHRPGL